MMLYWTRMSPSPRVKEQAVSDDLVRELRDVITPVPERVPSTASLEAYEIPPLVRPIPESISMPEVQLDAHPFLADDPYIRRSVMVHAAPPRSWWSGLLSLTPWLFGAGCIVAGLLYVSEYGLHMKSKVIQQGSAAVGHMVAAKDQLERLNWSGAHDRFELAKSGFAQASSQLGILGPSVTGFLARIPGLHGLRSGEDILHAGQLLAEAGSALADAVSPLTKTSPAAIGTIAIIPADRLTTLANALTAASGKITEAQHLLADVRSADIPNDMQEQFHLFTDRLPEMQELVRNSSDAITFLRRFSGSDRPRRYLVLFQNSSELRPTGGFPGSYGLLTMENGVIKDWRADDIYNPDGQLHDLVIPPTQLQHITPGWGMRDANWFADFPLSARKIMEFWQRDGGAAVDGVLAIRPSVLASILKVTGPVSLPTYGTVLTSENVLVMLQQEVEENRDTGQPKQVIADLAPLMLERMASLPADQWFGLLDTFRAFGDRRDILAYFGDEQLESYITKEGWSGAVAQSSGDYLMTVISNIKGAKSDAVTDTSLKLEARMESGTLVHRLTITREHNGGKTPYGFYNKTSYAYVRVLVPKGSTLRGLVGNDHPANHPLMTYAKGTEHDPDVVALEAGSHIDGRWDATIGEESGKTSFGFWMRIEPGTTQAVQLEYAVPAAVSGNPYELFIQRQPGLDLGDVEVTLDKEGFRVTSSSLPLTDWPDSRRLHTRLDTDLHLRVDLAQ